MVISPADDGLRPSGDQIFSPDCMTWYNCTARCYLTTWTKSTALPYSSSCKHKCYTPGAGETKTKQQNSHFFVLRVFFKQIRGCSWTTDNKMRLSDVIFFSVHTWPLTSKKRRKLHSQEQNDPLLLSPSYTSSLLNSKLNSSTIPIGRVNDSYKKNDTHAHKNHLTLSGVQAVCTGNIARHCASKIKSGLTKHMTTPRICG